MVERMEKHWKQWEQPLLILSMVLHPSYKVSRFCTSTPNLSMVHLGKWLKYYYEAWFGHKPRTILAEFMQYMKSLDPLMMIHLLNLKANWLPFGNLLVE